MTEGSSSKSTPITLNLCLALSKKGGQQSQNFLNHNTEIPVLIPGGKAPTIHTTINKSWIVGGAVRRVGAADAITLVRHLSIERNPHINTCYISQNE